jgi:nucleotide-binding universal stress UspA family protein
MAIEKVLVPVDYSEASRAALAFAADFASKNGAMLEIVHVWDRPSYVSEGVTIRQGDGSTRSLIEMIRENAEREMDDFITQTKLPATVRYEKHLVGGNPAAKILAELERGRHDLIVVGTHGRTGLPHLLLGSVAEKLDRLSPVPVLTVPSPGRPVTSRVSS